MYPRTYVKCASLAELNCNLAGSDRRDWVTTAAARAEKRKRSGRPLALAHLEHRQRREKCTPSRIGERCLYEYSRSIKFDNTAVKCYFCAMYIRLAS